MDWIRKVPIGQYVSGRSSWIRLIDPRLKFSWVLLFLLTPVLANPSWRMGLVFVLLLITFFSRLPVRIWWRGLFLLMLLSLFVGALAMFLPTSEAAATLTVRSSTELPNAIATGSPWELIHFGPFKVANVSLGPLIVDRRSIELGIKSSTLLFTVVHSVNLMLMTTRPEALVWSLRWFISPLAKIGFPIERVSFQLLLALRFLPLIQEEFQNLIRSLATRAVSFKKLGLKASIGLILAVGERLLANILLRADQGAEALLARNSSLLPAEYFKPQKNLVKVTKINVGAAFFLLIALLLRGNLGGL
tara:strand:+ start:247 stop:1158 length:912 start_codon:yes stop_codon:yes gene_type:complete